MVRVCSNSTHRYKTVEVRDTLTIISTQIISGRVGRTLVPVIGSWTTTFTIVV